MKTQHYRKEYSRKRRKALAKKGRRREAKAAIKEQLK